MAEKELNRAKIQPLGQPATRGLVSQIVPVQIDLCELLAIDAAMRVLPNSLTGVLTVVGVPSRCDRVRLRPIPIGN